MQTSNLTGAALNWAVARCEGGVGKNQLLGAWYAPSTDWAQGGTIIEREGIELHYWGHHSMPWRATIDGDTDAGIDLYEETGNTPLEAAMRCYVASKLGDEVDLPPNL